MMTRAPPTAKAKTSAKMLMGESLADPPVAAGDTVVVQECSTLVKTTAFVARQNNSRSRRQYVLVHYYYCYYCCCTIILLLYSLVSRVRTVCTRDVYTHRGARGWPPNIQELLSKAYVSRVESRNIETRTDSVPYSHLR